MESRFHGTAMASLVIHGDRNLNEEPLSRLVYLVPVLGDGDRFPRDRLIVDIVYQAILDMKAGPAPSAPDVVIVNLSLGNARSPFHGRVSAWARLLDRLSYEYGILFIVSAGNHLDDFEIEGYATSTEYSDAATGDRSTATLRSLGGLIRHRRLLAPAESVNAVSVGAVNQDAVSDQDRASAVAHIDPYAAMTMANPTSALGPGFSNSIKPDLLFPGSREHVLSILSGERLVVRASPSARAHGLKVAAPGARGRANFEGYSGGTSAAAALGSRAAHGIYDALEAEYGDDFLGLADRQKAVLLKAILTHSARWPTETSSFIRSILGPPDGRQHVKQRDNIRRFIGYGIADPTICFGCEDDRVTFWATGTLRSDHIVDVNVPIPYSMHGKARPHHVRATLAWLSPIMPSRQTYRTVRLRILEPSDLMPLRVSGAREQPDQNQIRRGTTCSRTWEGDRAPALTANHELPLSIQRDADIGSPIDEPVPFGLAVTVAMAGVIEIYQEVRARLAVRPLPPVRVR